MSEVTIAAIINACATIIVAVLGLLINRNVKIYRKEVNGHMTELLKLKKAEGKEEGKEEQIEIDKNK